MRFSTHRFLPSALIVAALAAGGAVSHDQPRQPPDTQEPDVPTLPEFRGGQDRIGGKMPDLHFDRWLNTPDDEPLDTEDRITLYRWWTDGCPYCEASLPAIEALRKKYEDRGLLVVGAYHPKPPQRTDGERVAAVAARIGYDGAIAVDEDWSELRRAYLDHGRRRATSVSLLVDAEGVIRFVHPGPQLFPSDDPRHAQENADFERLDRAIDALLTEACGDEPPDAPKPAD